MDMIEMFDATGDSGCEAFVHSEVPVPHDPYGYYDFDARDTPWVMLWGANATDDRDATPAERNTALRAFLEDTFGLTVHDGRDIMADLRDYDLIIWLIAESDPWWLSALRNNLWQGRLVVTGEWVATPTRGFVDSAAYVTSLSPFTHITLGGPGNGLFENWRSAHYHPIAPRHPITRNMYEIVGALTNQVFVEEGASVMYRATEDLVDMMAYSENGEVSIVVSGDSNCFWEVPPIIEDVFVHNRVFLANLYNTPKLADLEGEMDGRN